jgi:putative membrane protein
MDWYPVLLFSSLDHRDYSYRTNRRYYSQSDKTAIEIINERYARGDIDHQKFSRVNLEIVSH